jgi:hypothetical protein
MRNGRNDHDADDMGSSGSVPTTPSHFGLIDPGENGATGNGSHGYGVARGSTGRATSDNDADDGASGPGGDGAMAPSPIGGSTGRGGISAVQSRPRTNRSR